MWQRSRLSNLEEEVMFLIKFIDRHCFSWHIQRTKNSVISGYSTLSWPHMIHMVKLWTSQSTDFGTNSKMVTPHFIGICDSFILSLSILIYSPIYKWCCFSSFISGMSALKLIHFKDHIFFEEHIYYYNHEIIIEIKMGSKNLRIAKKQ